MKDLLERLYEEGDDVSPEIPEVDFGPLEVELEKVMGVPIKLSSEITKGRYGKPRLEFNSGNLVEHAGIFKAAFKLVEVQSFGGGDVNEDGVIWWTVNLYYEHKAGGSNGVGILSSARYDTKDGKWSFIRPGN